MLDRKPYTYLIGWSQHNKWYYGSRYAKGCHPDDLWKSYFTSSKHVKEYRELYGVPDIIQIRRTFDNPSKARNWEYRVLRRLDVINKDVWLNKHLGNDKFFTKGPLSINQIQKQKETMKKKSQEELLQIYSKMVINRKRTMSLKPIEEIKEFYDRASNTKNRKNDKEKEEIVNKWKNTFSLKSKEEIEEINNKKSISNKNKPKSPSHRNNISNATKGHIKPKFLCDKCSRTIGGKSNFDRHVLLCQEVKTKD